MLLLFICHVPRNDLNIDEIKEVAAEHGITQPIYVDSEHKLGRYV